jgi:hypothetical protein
VLESLNPFSRGKKRPVRPAPPALFRIDLGPVDEPMTNGRTERMSFSTSERMSLGKEKRVAAQPIGKVPDRSERNFDWQSVQSPDRRRADQEPEFDGNGFRRRARASVRPPGTLRRRCIGSRARPAQAARSSWRRSCRRSGALTVQGRAERVSATAWWCAA